LLIFKQLELIFGYVYIYPNSIVSKIYNFISIYISIMTDLLASIYRMQHKKEDNVVKSLPQYLQKVFYMRKKL